MSNTTTLTTPVAAEIQIACQQTLEAFMGHFDMDEFAAMEPYLTDDAVWVRADGVLHGCDGLRAWAAKRQPGIFVRHVLTNFRCKRLSDTEVHVDSYAMVFRKDMQAGEKPPATMSGPVLMGRYEDVLRQVDGRWLIAHKSVKIDFKLA
jgi:ketosteroid isomerase-like protein